MKDFTFDQMTAKGLRRAKAAFLSSWLEAHPAILLSLKAFGVNL